MTLCKYCHEYEKEGHFCDECEEFVCEDCAEEFMQTYVRDYDDIENVCLECDKANKKYL